MKQTKLVLLILAISLAFNANGQEVPSDRLQIETNAVAMLCAEPNLTVNFRVSDRLSLGLSAGYYNTGFLWTEQKSLRANFKINYSLTGQAMRDGLVGALSLGASHEDLTNADFIFADTGDHYEYVEQHLGLTLHYQWVFDSGLTVGLGGGMDMKNVVGTVEGLDAEDEETFHDQATDVAPILILNMGWVF
jgi:hypothetical protein